MKTHLILAAMLVLVGIVGAQDTSRFFPISGNDTLWNTIKWDQDDSWVWTETREGLKAHMGETRYYIGESYLNEHYTPKLTLVGIGKPSTPSLELPPVFDENYPW